MKTSLLALIDTGQPVGNSTNFMELDKVYITKQDKFVMEKELKRARFVGWGLNQREEIHI